MGDPMKPITIFYACLLLTAATGAQAAPRGITYDCDTAAGHFSELDLPAQPGAFRVTGNIQVNNIATDKKWAPTVRVRVASAPPQGGAAPANYAGLELTALPGAALKLDAKTVQAFSFDATGQESDMIPTSIQPAGPVQPFLLAYDGKSVSVTVAGSTRSFPLTTSDPVVQVICSTGEFLLTDLAVQPSS
jgi:hypothetical protein